jgi:sec-independent protein translocase protein TatA
MAGIGAPELIIVLVVILVLFGGAKLPKLARSLGEARREFEKGNEEAEREERRKEAARTLDPVVDREAELRIREAELAKREAEVRGLDGETR